MRTLGRVGEEVDPANGVHDAGRPDASISAAQWGGSFAGEFGGQGTAQVGVLAVEVFAAEPVGDLHDLA